MIVERTNEGQAIAHKKDIFTEGRLFKYGEVQLAHALKLLEIYWVGQSTGIH